MIKIAGAGANYTNGKRRWPASRGSIEKQWKDGPMITALPTILWSKCNDGERADLTLLGVLELLGLRTTSERRVARCTPCTDTAGYARFAGF